MCISGFRLSDSSYLRTGIVPLLAQSLRHTIAAICRRASGVEVKVKLLCKLSGIVGLTTLLLGGAYASDTSHPEFDRYVSPAYPSSLRGGKLSSSARVHYDVHNDGSVSDIQVIERTDLRTANAVVSAIKRWRFKPWDVTDGMPAVIGESVQYLFDQERLEKRLRMVISWERRQEP
jgi:TonB family protein